MLRKKTKENIKKFDKEQYKIRFRQNSDENPQKRKLASQKIMER